MEGEANTLRSLTNESNKSFDTISILVVDDDTTCLSVVSAILKRFKYKVVTVKHPNDALCTLRIKSGAFNLVVSDVHMPDMNGFELQKVIAQEFNLPVVLMSADDKESNVMKGLDSGAAFYIAKPVCPDDFKDLWQFANMKKKSQVVIEETGSSPVEEITSPDKNTSDDLQMITASASSVNVDTSPTTTSPTTTKDLKRKSPKKDGPGDGQRGETSGSPSPKKQKIIWSNSLHNRFLEAIRSIGLERAVPKKILEVMDIPGLTRENVASHLQKYRIFLRRVSDASFDVRHTSEKGLSKSIKSIFGSSLRNPSSLMLNGLPSLRTQNRGRFPSLESSSSPMTQSGFGQSRLLSKKGSNMFKPSIGNTDLVNPSPNPYVGLANNTYQASTSMQGHRSNMMTIRDLSRALSVDLDDSNRKSPGNGYEFSSHVNIGNDTNANPNPNPFVPFESFTVPYSKYVGLSTSNLKDLMDRKGKGKIHAEGLNSCGITMNLPSDESGNHRVNDSTLMTNEGAVIANEGISFDELTQNVGASSSFVPENKGGDELSDILRDYQMLLPSNQFMIPGVENGGQLPHDSGFTPMFDFPPAFDNMINNQQPLEEADFGINFADQANFQTQGQQSNVNTITSDDIFDGMDQWDDNDLLLFAQAHNQQENQGLINPQEFGIPSQLNEAILLPSNEQQSTGSFMNSFQFGATSQIFVRTPPPPSPPESQHIDDDEFLNSLLAPFEDDEAVEGF